MYHRKHFRRTALLLTTTLLLAFSVLGRQQNAANVSSAGGVTTIEFEVVSGNVKVYLPDDLASGDTISGTVTTSVSNAELSGSVVDIGGRRIPVNTGNFTISLPQTTELVVRLVNNVGSSIGSTTMTIYRTSGIGRPDVTFPELSQVGRPYVITGPFDGDLRNTACSIGGVDVPILAESPRKAVVMPSVQNIGDRPITFMNVGSLATGQVRTVGINLTAPKTQLVKGEKTTLNIQVTGLSGIQRPIEVTVDCSGAASISGGDRQVVKVPQPGQGFDSGQVSLELTGIKAGGFNVTATVVVPISNLSGETVHVEGTPNGGGGLWQVKVKLPSGRIVNIYVRSEKKPGLKYCDWIKIDDVTSENGELYVGKHEKVADPNKKPPPSEPKSTETAKTTKTDPKDDPEPPKVPVVSPCKNGDIRVISVTTRTFEVIDPNGEVIVKLYNDKQGAAESAEAMAEFWRQIAKAGGLLDHLPESSGVGAGVASWLFEYLEKGADILDATAKSKLRNYGVSKVTVEIYIGTKKITVTCIIQEVCKNGAWVRDHKIEKSEVRSSLKASKSVSKSDPNWDEVSEDSRPQFYDPDKAEKWAREFLKEKVNILKGGEGEMAGFVNNCK